MMWEWSTILFVAAVLVAIVTVVLFIISWASNTPFNLNSRSEGLQVSAVLALLSIWFVAGAIYLGGVAVERKKIAMAASMV